MVCRDLRAISEPGAVPRRIDDDNAGFRFQACTSRDFEAFGVCLPCGLRVQPKRLEP